MQFTSAMMALFKLINTRSLSLDGRQMLRLRCLWTLGAFFFPVQITSSCYINWGSKV